jgi:thioredoxin 1
MSGKNLKDIKNEKDFDSLIKEGRVVVDFYADWCGPCKILSPIIADISSEYDGTVKFAKVDVDGNQKLSQRFQVMSIPTVIFFKEGEQVERFSGALPKDEIKKKIDEAF